MHDRRVAILTVSILLTRSAYAANPFLAAPDDKPVTAEFRGTEWGDNISQEEIPLTARVVTTRVAKMSWGAIFKIEFVDLKSRAAQKREIGRIWSHQKRETAVTSTHKQVSVLGAMRHGFGRSSY